MTLADDVQYKIGGVVPVYVAAIGLTGGFLFYDSRKKKAAALAAQAASDAQAQTAQQDAQINNTLTSTSAADEIDPSTGMTFAQEQSVDPATGQTYLSEWESANQQFTSPYTGTSPLASANGIQYQTNQQWAQAAENFLISKGLSPTSVMSAINNYLNGNSLNPSEESIVNTAASTLGAPPENVTSSGVTDPTTSAPSSTRTISGYIQVGSVTEAHAYAKNGATVYVLPAGMPPQSGSLIPWLLPGDKAAPSVTYPPGSSLWIKG